MSSSLSVSNSSPTHEFSCRTDLTTYSADFWFSQFTKFKSFMKCTPVKWIPNFWLFNNSLTNASSREESCLVSRRALG